MRLRLLSAALVALLVLTLAGCSKDDTVTLPGPASIINGTRDRLNPFRFTLTTDPASPSASGYFTVRVHVIDAEGNPAEGINLQGDVSIGGIGEGPQHISFDDRGAGDYEAELDLNIPGSYSMNVTADKDGKHKEQRFYIDVGG
jgi:hypothetical protein